MSVNEMSAPQEQTIRSIVTELHRKHGSGLPMPGLKFDYRRTRGGRTTLLGQYVAKEKALRFLMMNLAGCDEAKLFLTVAHEYAHFLQFHDPMGRGTSHGHVFKKYARIIGIQGKATIRVTQFDPLPRPAPQTVQPIQPTPVQLNPVTARMRELWLKTRQSVPTGS